jgi:DNA replication and repair protein RecF
VVLFSSQDIDMVGGAPALRRRYLDIALSQMDPRYLRSSQAYNRVLLQRNHLLRLIKEGRAKSNQLAFWDEELVKTGSYIIVQRQNMVAALADLAASTHRRLTAEQEALQVIYVGSISKEVTEGSPEEEQIQTVAAAFLDQLQAHQAKEIERGMTLVGPHRDDLQLLANSIDMGVFASRGQQRTIALSLKLAEASLMQARTGDQPILLLDDVLSELDTERRCHLLEAATCYQQVFITTTSEMGSYPVQSATGPDPAPLALFDGVCYLHVELDF